MKNKAMKAGTICCCEAQTSLEAFIVSPRGMEVNAVFCTKEVLAGWPTLPVAKDLKLQLSV
jgi:hypothetical protein